MLLSVGWSVVMASADQTTSQLRYSVEVNAPSPLKDAVVRKLDLIRWQSYTDLTPEFLELLVADAKREAREVAEAEGYFSAIVRTEIDSSTTPPTVRIDIEPGAPTVVTSVMIDVVGAASSEVPEGTTQIARMQSAWTLPEGSLFRQADWTAAKAAAVRALARNRYAAAQLTASEASIDPATREAKLAVTIDSGPRFHFGPLQISGLAKYREEAVRNLVTFAQGETFSEEKLDQFVRRLAATGYFATAQAQIVPDIGRADAAPVKVAVIEAPTKKITTGVGYSTDTLYRAQLGYADANLGGNGLQFSADLRAEGKEQSGTLRLVLPPRVPDYTDALGARIAHTDISGLRTDDLDFGWKRRTADERTQTTYSAAFYTSRAMPKNAEAYDAHALFPEVGRTWRDVDDLLSPTRGRVVNVQLGAGLPGASTRAFGRGIAQLAAWMPFDGKTSLALKAEAGATLVSNSRNVPTPLLFRTGGDTTVRGYAFQSLGPRLGDATVGGRYYALASVEVVRWITPVWGVAAFVDAGNAADHLHELSPAYGYGVGARVKTPIGPLRLDVAYGERTRTVRLHVSVGLTF